LKSKFILVADVSTSAQAEIVVYRWTHRAFIPLVYSWNEDFADCRRLHLEWFAGGCDLCCITACV